MRRDERAHRVDVGRDEVMRHDAREEVEPERGHRGQHRALAGDRGRQDVVEGRDPIGRHDEQVVADGVQVADLAAVEELDSLEVRLGQRGWHRVRRERSDR